MNVSNQYGTVQHALKAHLSDLNSCKTVSEVQSLVVKAITFECKPTRYIKQLFERFMTISDLYSAKKYYKNIVYKEFKAMPKSEQYWRAEGYDKVDDLGQTFVSLFKNK